MSTAASVEKKTKKPAKKTSKKEVKMEKVEEAAPVIQTEEPTPEPVINEESTAIEHSEFNSEFYTLIDKITTSFNELNEISKKLDIIDEKQIKNFIAEKKKMDKAISIFEMSYLESIAGAFKIAKKSSSKKMAKKVYDSSNPGPEPAVKKPLECESCLHEFMGKTDSSELIKEIAYTAVTDFTNQKRNQS